MNNIDEIICKISAIVVDKASNDDALVQIVKAVKPLIIANRDILAAGPDEAMDIYFSHAILRTEDVDLYVYTAYDAIAGVIISEIY